MYAIRSLLIKLITGTSKVANGRISRSKQSDSIFQRSIAMLELKNQRSISKVSTQRLMRTRAASKDVVLEIMLQVVGSIN